MEDVKYDITIGIPEFYKGKSIFVTGFTGSLGKLIVEKLMFSCPEVDKIYLLIRSKKGRTPQERAQEIMASDAFSRIREKYPGALESKVVAISGDMMEDKLGLSQQDEQLLREQVSVIFHSAASVRFDDPLKLAVEMNTLGAKKLVDLALTMPKLVCFTHISTAYSNCDRTHIKEEIYPPRADWRKTHEIVKKVDPAAIQILHEKYMNGMPNTYVYSKSLAEDVINDYRDKLPMVIVRPAIIVPSYKEPVAGWTDNKYGPVGLIIGFFVGLVRCSMVDTEAMCNYIPSDIVVNATLVIAWFESVTRKRGEVGDSVELYNICSPPSYNLDHRRFSLLYRENDVLESMQDDGLNFENVWFNSSKFMFKLNNLYRHVLPAYIIDLFLMLANKTPIMVRVRRKVFAAISDISYFATKTFIFETDKFDSVVKQVKPGDQDFAWDFTDADIVTVYRNVYHVSKGTILKPLFDDLETNRKRLRYLYFVDRASVYMTIALGVFIVYFFRIPQLVLTSLISFATLP